jgi:hypothetical protein
LHYFLGPYLTNAIRIAADGIEIVVRYERRNSLAAPGKWYGDHRRLKAFEKLERAGSIRGDLPPLRSPSDKRLKDAGGSRRPFVRAVVALLMQANR